MPTSTPRPFPLLTHIVVALLTSNLRAQECSAPETFGAVPAEARHISPQVTSDDGGNASIIWIRESSGSATRGLAPAAANGDLHTVRYSAGSGLWTSLAILMSGPVRDPQIATAADGSVLAVWCQNDGRDQLWGASYASSEVVDITATTAGNGCHAPDLAGGPGGRVDAVWARLLNDGLWTVQWSRFVPGRGWTPPLSISKGAMDVYAPDVDVDASGNAFAIWTERQGPHIVVHAAVYDASSDSWSAPSNLGQGGSPELATNAAGDVIFVWDGPEATIKAARYDRASRTITAPVTLGPGVGAHVAVGPEGDAMVIWLNLGTLYMVRYDRSAKTWSAPVAITSHLEGNAGAPELIAHSDGSYTMAWTQFHSGYRVIHAAHYSRSAALLSSTPVGLGAGPRLASGDGKTVTIAWTTGICSLSEGCPTPNKIQAVRCSMPNERRRASGR